MTHVGDSKIEPSLGQSGFQQAIAEDQCSETTVGEIEACQTHQQEESYDQLLQQGEAYLAQARAYRKAKDYHFSAQFDQFKQAVQFFKKASYLLSYAQAAMETKQEEGLRKLFAQAYLAWGYANHAGHSYLAIDQQGDMDRLEARFFRERASALYRKALLLDSDQALTALSMLPGQVDATLTASLKRAEYSQRGHEELAQSQEYQQNPARLWEAYQAAHEARG